MRFYIGVTDDEWFGFLAGLPGIDEVNFWQPGGASGRFKALQPGEPFLFKLHAPNHFIAGGGFFAHHSVLPLSLAWESFREKNGASSFLSMKRLIEKRRRADNTFEDYKIGCIILTQPFFFRRGDWIPVPADFSLNIVQGKTYDTATFHGRALWDAVSERLALAQPYPDFTGEKRVAEAPGGYGKPVIIQQRLGQGTFRVMVTDAYERRCAVTQEKTLPALEAAHIKPFSESGPHRVDNGLLLRSDIHKLFDAGYVTVTQEHRFIVSHRIREEFENGRLYYALHGNRIHLPLDSRFRPGGEYLIWHNEHCFKG